MSLKEKITNLLESEIGGEKPIDIADHLIELIAEHLNGVQLGLFNQDNE
jgi:hypothetical protein